MIYVLYPIVTLLFVTGDCYCVCGCNRKRSHDFVKFEVTHQYLLFQHPQACSSMLTTRSSSSSVKSPTGKGTYHHTYYHHHGHASSAAHHGPISPPRIPQHQNIVHPQQGGSRQGWVSPSRELEVSDRNILCRVRHHKTKNTMTMNGLELGV